MILEKLYTDLRHTALLEGLSHIDIALSGGADSVFLAYLLKSYRDKYAPNLSLRAHHIRHGLRESDGHDREVAQNVAQILDLPFICTELHLGKIETNIEAAARDARYQALLRALREIAPEDGALALAHHGDDNLETAIWRLGRGCGLEGLTISPRSHSGDVPFIRPLLGVSKDEIYAALKELGLPWAEDPTNAGDHYKRNRIRHDIIPMIKRESSAPDVLYRSLRNIERDACALSSFASNFVKRYPVRYDGWFCPFEDWQKLELSAQLQVLRHIVHSMSLNAQPDAGIVQKAAHMLNARSQTCRKIAVGELWIGWCKAGVMVWRDNRFCDMPQDIPLDLPAFQMDAFGFGKITLMPYICTAQIPNTTSQLHFVQPSDTNSLAIRPAGAYTELRASDGHRVPMREALRNALIPNIWHDFWPVLCDGDRPLWIVGGMRTNDAAPPNPGDRAIAAIFSGK